MRPQRNRTKPFKVSKCNGVLQGGRL